MKFWHLLTWIVENGARTVIVGLILGIVWFATYPARINWRIHQGMEYTEVLAVVGKTPWKRLKHTDFCNDYKVEIICSLQSDDMINIWIVGVDTILYVATNASGVVTRHGFFDT